MANGTNVLDATVKFTAINETPTFIDVAGSSRTLDARTTTFVIAPDAPVVKRGAGALLLGAGAGNNWMSSLAISNGTVSFGSLFSTFPVTLVNGTVTGPGGTGPLTQDGGLLLPGTPTGSGSLTVNGDANLNSGNVQFHLTGAIPGSGFGQLRVNGTLNLAGVTLTVTLGFTPTVGTEFVLIANDGTDVIAGTGFAGRPEGSVFTVAGTAFAVNYHGGDGNDVSLTAVVPPVGASKIWDGGGTTGLWSNRFNWVGDAAPLAGMDLIFTNAARSNATNDFPVGTSFNSIRFMGSMLFDLLGNGVVLTGGITNQSSQNQLVDVRVTLAGSQTWNLESSNTMFLSGGLAGPSGATLRKRGPGRLHFAASSAATTFDGLMRIEEGEVLAGNLTTAIVGPVEVLDGAALRVDIHAQFAGRPPVTVQPGGLFHLANVGTLSFANTIGDLTVNGGELRLAGGPIEVQGNLVMSGGALLNHTVAAVRTNVGLTSVTGTVALAGCTLEFASSNLFSPGEELILITNLGSDPVQGTFNGLPEGGSVTNLGRRFQISYTGGDGNDVVLTMTGFAVTGVTRVWSGAGANGFWTTPQNWQGALVPHDGDRVVFPEGAARLKATNDFAVTMLDSLQIEAPGYELEGNYTTLINGILVTATNSFSTILMPLEFPVSQTIEVPFRHTLGLGTITLPVSATLTKTGGGTINQTGGNPAAVPGAFTGVYRILEGELLLNTFAGGRPIGGPCIVGGGTGSALLLAIRSNCFIGNPSVTVLSNGIFRDQSGGTNRVGAVAVTNGVLQRFGGQLFLSGDLSLGAGSTFSGSVSTNFNSEVLVNGAVRLNGARLILQLDSSSLPLTPGRKFTLIDNDAADPVIGTFDGLPEGAQLVDEDGRIYFRLSYLGGLPGNDVVVTVLGPTGTERVWTGAGANAGWSTPANWQGSVVPVPGDAVVFPVSASRRVSVNDLPSGLLLHSLRFLGGGYDLRGNGVRLANGLTNAPAVTNRLAMAWA